MKNIKLSFLGTMIFATSMSGMEIFLKQQLETLSAEMQNLLIARENQQFVRENHNENLQQAKDNRQFARENQQFFKENHNENLQQAKDNRRFTKEEHEEKQGIALDKRRVSLTNEESDLLVTNSKVATQLALNEQKRALIAQETKQKMDAINIEIEAEESKAENIFRLCLVKNRYNSDLGAFRFPKVCEDSAKVLRLLGYSSLVNELTEEFQK